MWRTSIVSLSQHVIVTLSLKCKEMILRVCLKYELLLYPTQTSNHVQIYQRLSGSQVHWGRTKRFGCASEYSVLTEPTAPWFTSAMGAPCAERADSFGADAQYHDASKCHVSYVLLMSFVYKEFRWKVQPLFAFRTLNDKVSRTI
jgi:hypothetical protein